MTTTQTTEKSGVRPDTKGDQTPDSHDFPTRPYDLVREFVIALVVVIVLSGGLAAIFSSPDDPAITMAGWAKTAPSDVVATAAGELAGTTTSAGYGPPYNSNADGQKLGVGKHVSIGLENLGRPGRKAQVVLGQRFQRVAIDDSMNAEAFVGRQRRRGRRRRGWLPALVQLPALVEESCKKSSQTFVVGLAGRSS